MTRKKKSRSLKRIHGVKTGAIQKLKREAGHDRQTGKRVKNTTKSVFQKFLDENPEAKKDLIKDQQTAAHKSAMNDLEKANKAQAKAAELEEKAQRRAAKLKQKLEEKEQGSGEQNDGDLLDRLDQNFLDDIY